jgi:translation initiation factor 3 subunit L
MGPGPSQDENRDLKKEIEALIIHLLCFKHKMKNVVWTKGTSGLEGQFQSGSEVGMGFLMYRHTNTIHPL